MAKRTINGIIARALAQSRADGLPTRVWGVFDGARDPEIHAAASRSGARGVCLYGDDVPTELARVAPWLLPVPPESTFGTLFATVGRGRAWGVLLRTAATSEELAHHFVGLLRAKVPDGRTLLFRFYDPRVLAAILPTCTPSQLDQMFGPCEAFLIEHPDGTHREYRRSDGALAIAQPRWDQWID
jgi:hypothetical protein